MKKVIVVGLGSMGKRRIRLIRLINPQTVICGVDSQESRREEAEKQFGIITHGSIQEAVANESPEAGFVCTSPLSHRAVITELLEAG